MPRKPKMLSTSPGCSVVAVSGKGFRAEDVVGTNCQEVNSATCSLNRSSIGANLSLACLEWQSLESAEAYLPDLQRRNRLCPNYYIWYRQNHR